ncbi:beta-lactamase family protein [bacterium]|nr:beta-lactamase family protein [bacterium]
MEDRVPISHETKFRIGSISKMFTAAIIFQLIEEGHLTLDTKLSDFYSQIPNAESITISHLLNHRSGIHSFTSDSTYFDYYTSPKSKEEILTLITQSEPDFQPDEKVAYSNANFVLLGYIIEDITHSTYPEELKKRITVPFNLNDTYYGGEIEPEENEASSYNFENNEWIIQPENDMSIPHGAGVIVSTPRDLTSFVTSLFSCKMVTETSLEKMKETDHVFGRGLLRFPFYDRYSYGYNGGIDGCVSYVSYFPEDKVATAFTSNGMNYSLNDILIGILNIYFDLPFDIPDLGAKEIALERENLQKYQGTFSSETLPLKITLHVDGNTLFGQATGQSAFPLSPFSETEFRFEIAGIVIEFSKDVKGTVQYDTFHLRQSGGDYLFTREQ